MNTREEHENFSRYSGQPRINLFSHYLRLDGHAVIQSESDADAQIVSAGIALAGLKQVSIPL